MIIQINLTPKIFTYFILLIIPFLFYTCINSVDPTSEDEKASPGTAVSYPDTVPLGTVVYSILTETEFQSQRGGNWALVRGQDISGSALAELTGVTTLPDGRGLFFRSLNNGRSDALADSESSRSMASTQIDSTARPNVPFTGNTTSSGEHTHTGLIRNLRGDADKGGGNRTVNGNNGYTITGGAHTHSTAITGGGDSETRPNNMALNTFIKIN